MRIGLVIYGSLDFPSGGFLYDRKVIEHLQHQGHKTAVFSLPWRKYPLLIAQNYSPKFFEQIRNFQADILLQDELNYPSLFIANRKFKRELNVPLISIVHHLRISEGHPRILMGLYRELERRYLNGVDGFIFNSRTTRGSVVRLLDAEKPYVIANPSGDRFAPQYDEQFVRRRSELEGPLQIIFVGSLIPRKAPHLILEAISQLPKGNFHLTLAGSLDADPSYVRKMKNFAKQKHLGNHINFVGNLLDDALAERMKKNQVLVVPSIYEGYGIAYAEGMSFALPAIGTSSGAANEIILHGQNGYLIQSGSSQELAEHLSSFFNDRQQLFEMSKAARKRFTELPSWQHSLQRIESFLIETIIK